MINKFCEHLFIRLRERQGVYTERILSGSFQALDEYKLLIGKLNGILESEDIIKNLYSEMFEGKRIDRNIIEEEEEIVE